jgi:hypothetical protein
VLELGGSNALASNPTSKARNVKPRMPSMTYVTTDSKARHKGQPQIGTIFTTRGLNGSIKSASEFAS